MGVIMDFSALKEKAYSLPMSPGVYLMKDKNDIVIYVGKAKKLSRMDFTLLPVLNLLSIQLLALLKRACLTCLQYNRTKIHNHQNLNIK